VNLIYSKQSLLPHNQSKQIMAVEIVTKEDLQIFKTELLSELEQMFNNKTGPTKKWLRSPEVRKLLNISLGTLQNLRINGTLKTQKIGGIIYYDYSEIEKLLSGI
jgi:hypothetical protein